MIIGKVMGFFHGPNNTSYIEVRVTKRVRGPIERRTIKIWNGNSGACQVPRLQALYKSGRSYRFTLSDYSSIYELFAPQPYQGRVGRAALYFINTCG